MIISTINGTLGSNAEVKQVGNQKVLTFNVAAGKKKTTDNQYETIWVKCVKFYNNDSKIYNQEHLIKGAKVSLYGKTEVESYISKTNEFKAAIKVYIDHFEVFDRNISTVKDQNNGNPSFFNQEIIQEHNKNTDFNPKNDAFEDEFPF